MKVYTFSIYYYTIQGRETYTVIHDDGDRMEACIIAKEMHRKKHNLPKDATIHVILESESPINNLAYYDSNGGGWFTLFKEETTTPDEVTKLKNFLN